jgi:hypothetical protein
MLDQCLTEGQKYYTKWRATSTSRNVGYFSTLTLLFGNAKIVRQATSGGQPFENGFLRLIHGKITISLTVRATRRRRSGSFEAKPSGNGRRLGWVLFYGSTENVRRSPAFAETDGHYFL